MVVSRLRVRSSCQQDVGDVAARECRGYMQRCPAVHVASMGVRPGREQGGHYIAGASAGCDEQGRLPKVIRRLAVGAGFEQNMNGIGCIRLRPGEQRGPPVRVCSLQGNARGH